MDKVGGWCHVPCPEIDGMFRLVNMLFLREIFFRADYGNIFSC